MLAIEVKKLSRIFLPEGIRAVDNLNLKLQKGDIFAFLGPNGAGKTTSVRLLSTLLKPTDGTASIDGFSITDEPEEVRKRIGILTDQPNLYERLSARKNLIYFAKMYGVPRETARKRVNNLAIRFDLQSRLDSPTGTFSKGMKQKLGILRAIVHEPSVLFLDEPTAALDPIASQKVRETILDLTKESDVTIFMTTHNLSEADRMADSIGVINKGELLTIGSPRELKEKLSKTNQVSIQLVKEPVNVEKNLLAISGVKKVFTRGERNQFIVEVENYQSIVPQVVESLVADGRKVLEIRKLERSLEDVYMNIMKNNGGKN
ncbi:MAG: ABC transporter ATP-binding protein [Candidatus Hodarchaeales archaeon]|jgi:ABC-2 type transport system ATP-binding protein